MEPIIINSNQPIKVRHNGQVKTIAEWADDPSANIHGLSTGGIALRVATGESLADALDKHRNYGTCHLWEHEGRKVSLREIAELAENIYDLSPATIRYRLGLGLTVAESLATPLKAVNNRPLELAKSPQNIHKLTPATIRYRLNLGWTEADALGYLPQEIQSWPYKGKNLTIGQIARLDDNIHDLQENAIRYRLNKGATVEDALSQPSHWKRNRPAPRKAPAEKAPAVVPTVQAKQVCQVYRKIKIGGRTFESFWDGLGWAVGGHRAIVSVTKYQELRRTYPMAISIFCDRHGYPITE